MNRPGVRIYSGQLTNVGVGYVTLSVGSPSNPPARGRIVQVIAEILAGTGTEVAAIIEDTPINGQDVVFDDGAGGTIPPFNDASNPVYYEGLVGSLPVLVKVNGGADSTVKITLLIEPA